jgi:hypothetical protein
VHKPKAARLGDYVPGFWLFLAFAEPPFRALGLVPIGPSHLVAPALIASAFLFVLFRGVPRRGSTIPVGFFIWLSLFLLTTWTIISVDPLRSLNASAMLVYYMTVVLALALILQQKPSRATWALRGIVAGTVVCVLAALWWGQGFLTDRWTPAAGYNPSWFAAQLVAASFAAGGLATTSRTAGPRALFWSLAAVFLLGVILTQGRNALVGLALAYVVLTSISIWGSLVSGRAGSMVRLWVVAVGALSFVGILWYIVRSNDPLALARLEMLWEGDATRATAGRNERWRLVVAAAAQGDLFMGLKNANLVSPHGFTLGVSPHNQYLSFLVETAGSMAALLVVFHLWLVRCATRVNRLLPPAWLAIFLPLFALGNDVVYYPYYWLLLATLIALIHLQVGTNFRPGDSPSHGAVCQLSVRQPG